MSVPPACQLIPALESRRGVSCRGVVTAISTNALMEQLCLKYQQRPWTETLRLVYFCMDNPLRRPVSHAPDSPLLSCMEKIERTLHAKSMFSVMNALESLSRQKGLNVHVSPSGTSCYITSTMFYLEAQLGKDGNVMDVKLAHFGEAPMVCDDLVQLLSEIKAKGYLALKALEKDLYSMSLLDSNPAFLQLTDELTMDLPALFVLKFHQPVPMSSSSIEDIQRLTGIQISGLKLAPLYELIVQSALKEKRSEGLSTNESCFFVSLPDCPKHCYFINKDSEKSDLAGALVSKIPFSHPKCVPGVIEILRHQVAYNTLISSCVSDKHINEDDSELLYFEVVPHRNTSFCVFFLHPVEENLACVIIDVITSREVHCHVQLNPQDPALNCSDDFIARAVKRCMSVPVVMRAIFRNAAKVKADSETQDMDVDTKQPHEPPSEQITDSNSLKESPSVAGQHDLVVTDKPSITESTEENLSTAKLETLDDSMEKSNLSPRTETLCRAEEN
ncbi:mediator of RNA polymerase II transcription subunit 1-like isoform X10 [Myiozetetes cayanensis]|uniref:mediator of RNA polymerase II transcription subunit 1-like isoform X10 n=1 Tax=Myiozetetes cayanensis TaxID=478635 RepID=UPI002160B9EA|nr:mediator of RNA polymerase II transcription subunit 1-like isoform X10 [Myiozetetes cayanensis]